MQIFWWRDSSGTRIYTRTSVMRAVKATFFAFSVFSESRSHARYSYHAATNLYFSALSLTERALFRELIRQLDRKINPGLTKLTWNTDYVDSYIEDCFNETANVRPESLTSSTRARARARSPYKFMQYVRRLAVKFNFGLSVSSPFAVYLRLNN